MTTQNQIGPDWKARFDELSAQFHILSRACGNWRTWPNEVESDHEHPDWKVASAAIIERNALREALEVAKVALRNGSTWEDRYRAHEIVVAAIGHPQETKCFTCEGEQGLPATRSVLICEKCFGEE